jgi:hypothetical protein
LSSLAWYAANAVSRIVFGPGQRVLREGLCPHFAKRKLEREARGSDHCGQETGPEMMA